MNPIDPHNHKQLGNPTEYLYIDSANNQDWKNQNSLRDTWYFRVASRHISYPRSYYYWDVLFLYDWSPSIFMVYEIKSPLA